MKITKQFTNRESKSLDQYLQEIGKVDLLTPDEEIELAIRIKKGDELAKEKLVKANLRFVVSVAKQFQNQGLSLGDLINEGNIGLIKAAQRFDETRGFKFISYAVWWVRQSIMQAIAEAKILDMTTDEVAYALQISGRHVSMDAPLKAGDENKNSLIDVLPNDQQPLPDKELLKESLKNEVANVLSSLTEREAEVIKLYFGIEGDHSATLEEIGERFNLTRERVRQIKEKALRNLRHSKRSFKLKSYLG
ncbi:MAG: sigma-70 family RNA polymerase sigma factor [Ignavibacteriaceae bacterium]